MHQLPTSQLWKCLEMANVFLVSCVARKMPTARPAKDLYISVWFQKARRHVEKTGAPWLILSAKHGIVRPDQVIEPYEQSLNTMPVDARRQWADQVMAQMLELTPRPRGVIFLAGARYREFLVERLQGDCVQVEIPMKGLGIGEQLCWLSRS